MNRRCVSLLVLLTPLVAACAAYAPQPLQPHPPLLDGTTPQALAAGADRPWLAPARIDLSQPLDANAIATIAVIANPDLQAQRARAGIADAQAFSAGLLPDPTFSLEYDALLSGPDTLANLAAGLGLDLNALRSRGTARAKATAESRQVKADLAWSEWQTAGQARLQAVRILALQQQLAINATSRDQAADILSRTERAAGRGDIAGDQVQTARAAAFNAATAFDTAQRSLRTARLELNRLLGLPPETILTLADTAPPHDVPAAAILVDIAMTNRADLAALREGYSAQEDALRQAILDQFPTLDLTVNANRDTSENLTLGPAIGFTLPLWNRNRGNIAVERTTREALKAEYDARLFQTRAEITAAADDIAVVRGQRDQILAGLPAAQAYAASTAKAAADGDLSPATAEAAAQVLRDRQSQLAQADQDIAELTIGLELLTGTPQGRWPQ